jgi:hypothetical protein
MSQPTPIELENYMALAQRVMLSFQLIEEGLKAYLSIARDVVKASIPKELDFVFTSEEIDAMPLGRLTQAFGRYTKNRDLVQDLNRIRPMRNHASHKAFVYGFYSDFVEEIDFEEEFRSLEEARSAASTVFQALSREIDQVSDLLSAIKKPSEA